MSAEAIKEVRDATKSGILIGLAGVSGVRPRQDIDVYLQEDPKGFNLLVLALKHLQDISVDPKTNAPWPGEEQLMSYYELAGIHGLPKRAWNRIEKGNVIEKEEGYCPHGQVTFPTWHRPYLALFEQTLFITMLDIADTWEGDGLREQYRQSALNFRLPYWDYYRPRAYNQKGFTFPGIIKNGLTAYPYDFAAPLVFTTEELMIRQPKTNEAVPTRNPLFNYTFPKVIPDADWNEKDLNDIVGNKEQYPRDATKRYPLPKSSEGLDSITTFSAAVNNLRMDSNRLAIAMMSPSNKNPAYKEYEVFAFSVDRRTDPKKPSPKPPVPLPGQRYDSVKYVNAKASGSLENLHNMYHLLCGGGASSPKDQPGIVGKNIGGGGGHMSAVPISAYDPIFWFHHGQIERLFSIWQNVHEGEPTTNWYNAIPDEAEKPLLPFRKRDGRLDPDMWSSNDLQMISKLGYTYADITTGGGNDTSKRFADLYSWSISEERGPKMPQPVAPDVMKPIDVRETEFFQFIQRDKPQASALQVGILHEPELPEALIAEAKNTPGRDWYIDSNVTRLAFNGTFTIYFFISDDSEDGLAPAADQRFLTAGTLAAAHHIFTASVTDCPSCAAQEADGTVVSSTAAVTSLLLDFVATGQLASLEPSDVEPFLVKRLKWRVVTLDGKNQDTRALSKGKVFQVGISSSHKNAEGEYVPGNHWNVIEQIVRNASGQQDGS